MASADQPEAVRVTAAELFRAMDLARPGLEKVRAAVEAGDLAAAGAAWADCFRRRKRPTMHYDRATWPAYIRGEFPQVAEAMLADARRVASGHISHGTIRLPVTGGPPDGKIDWLHNPKKDTSYVSLVGSQWFLNPVGRAYLLTGDERFAEAFVWIFGSWFERQEAICKHQGGLGFNPVYRSYYPGIQARVLADNYYALAQSPALAPEVHVDVMRQLLACARFVARTQRSYSRSNQQVAALLALGVVGLMFPELKASPGWVARAERLMAMHLERSFFPDGGHRELCTQYHKTLLRDFAHAALVSERNGRPSPLLQGENGAAMERAYDWLARLVLPTGETPALHSAVFSTDYAVYLLISSAYRRRGDHAWLAQRFWQRGEAPTQKAPLAFGAYLLASPLSPAKLAQAKPRPPAYTSCHLEGSGFALMRTGWEPDGRYLLFQYGWANTGHAYPAALSFLLEMNGELVATHPGSPRSYRHPAYRYCHGTRSHNSVTIDGRSYPSVKGIAPGGRLEAHADLAGLWFVAGYHEGYKKPFGATHRRRIVAVKDGPILVFDRIEGGTGHRAQWSFHTPLTVQVEEQGRRIVLQGRRRYALVAAQAPEAVKQERHWAAVLPRDCQPSDCGREVNVVRLEQPIGEEGTSFAVALFEGEGSVERLAPRAFRLRAGDRSWLVALDAAEAPVATQGVRARARLAVAEWAKDKLRRAWAVDGTLLEANGRPLLQCATPYTGAVVPGAR